MNNSEKHKEAATPDGGPKKSVGRRQFLDYLLGMSAFATLAAIVYPVLRFLVPPTKVEAQENSVVAGSTAELVPNSGKIFKFGSKPGIIIRTESGELRSFTAVCTHLGCTVQYRSKEKDIFCACHNGVYDLFGKNVSGPPPRPLEPYKVNVQGEKINVSKK